MVRNSFRSRQCEICYYSLMMAGLLLLGVSSNLFGQDTLSARTQLLHQLRFTFDLNPDSLTLCDFYLLDGSLQRFETAEGVARPGIEFRSVDYVLLTFDMLPHKNCDLLLLVESNAPQSRRKKRSLLRELKAELAALPDLPENQPHCDGCKLISIDNQFYSPKEGRDRIRSLRARQIESIIVYDKPMSTVLFGTDGGKNGLIVIQMY